MSWWDTDPVAAPTGPAAPAGAPPGALVMPTITVKPDDAIPPAPPVASPAAPVAQGGGWWAADPVVPSAPRAPVPAAMAMEQKPPPQFQPPPPTADKAPEGRSWLDVPGEALSNLPASAGSFVSNLVQPFIHPVDTANSLLDIGKGVVSKVLDPRLFEDEATPPPEGPEAAAARAKVEGPANAVGNFFRDRYGSVEGFKNALATDPVGVAADLATIFTGGGSAAARVPGVVGKVGDVVNTVGRAIDPLTFSGNVLKKGGQLTGEAGAGTLGFTTGAGTEAVRETGRAGLSGNQVFKENMRGNVPIENIVDMARSAVDEMRQERAAAYRGGMVDISKDATVLSFDPIEKAVGKASEVGSYKGVPINRSASDVNSKIAEIVTEWKALDPKEFHTPEGLDALKRTIGDLRDSTEYGTPARVAADRVYNAVKGEIEAQAPAYAKIMEDYSKASDRLKETTKTFSLGEKATGDTAARKLGSVLRNNVQTNFGARAKLLDELAAHEPNLPAAIAGQSMNAFLPRGIVARGGGMLTGGSVAANPMSLAVLPAFSPRLVGETIYAGGRAAGAAGRAANALRINAPNVRAAGQASFQAGRGNALAR